MAIVSGVAFLVGVLVAAVQADWSIALYTIPGVLLATANLGAFGVIGAKLTDASQGRGNAAAWSILLFLKVGLSMAAVAWAASNLPIVSLLLALITFPAAVLLTGLQDTGTQAHVATTVES